MGPEAREAGSGRHDDDHPQPGLPAAAAAAGAILLVAVAFVPALAPEAAAQQEDTCVPQDPELDVSVILDRSGSMDGNKIANAREGAASFVRDLTANDQSGLVSYSSSARLDEPLSFDHTATADAIESLTSGGNTATGDAIDLSHDDLDQRSRAGVQPYMVLLTDGQTNTGLDPVTQADQAKADGVEIFVIGLGDNVNEPALKDIASDPVETHYFEPAADEDLEPIYDAIRDEIRGPAPFAGEAYGVRANVTTGQDLQKVAVHKTPRATIEDPAQAEVHVEETVEDVTVRFVAAEPELGGERGPDNVTATSSFSISDLRVEHGGETLVRADVLTARAHAWSSPAAEATSGAGTRAAGLQVQDQEVGASVPPNTVVPVPGHGTVTLNEQIETHTDENVTLRVNLVHLEVEDGAETVDVVVSSAYAAAGCTQDASFPVAQDGVGILTTDGEDEDIQQGPAAVDPWGCAEGTVAASGTGCSEGTVAVSGDGDADGTVAVSGDETARGAVAATGSGVAEGDLAAAGVTGTCNGKPCNDANLTGQADGHNTAVSGTDRASASQGLAASGTGPANATIGVAASGTGPATTLIGASASGTGPATTLIGASASGTGPATADLGAAVSGTDHARGTAAVTGTGTAEGEVLTAGVTGTCNGRPCNDVEPAGPAEGWNTAVSGTDDAHARQGAAVSGTDEASTVIGAAMSGDGPAKSGVGLAVSGTDEASTATGAAASGTGPASSGLGAAASGTDHAQGLVAVTGTGSAEGVVVAGVTGTCNGWSCHDVTPMGPAAGHNTAVSGTGDAHARQGAAVSGTGDADTRTGLAVSGCTGAEASLLGDTVVARGSPAPVCSLPAAGGASLLP